MDSVLIRKDKPADVDDIRKILAEITQAPVNEDFKPIIEEHAGNDQNACLVAEIGGVPAPRVRAIFPAAMAVAYFSLFIAN